MDADTAYVNFVVKFSPVPESVLRAAGVRTGADTGNPLKTMPRMDAGDSRSIPAADGLSARLTAEG